MAPLPDRVDSGQTAARSVLLPWVERLARAFLRGEPVGLPERDRDEQLAILRAAVELVTASTRRRPGAKRRAA
jgi:hypothetical protein